MASSPRSEQSAWSHIIISMGGAQLTFWRRQRPCAIPETFHPKLQGLPCPTYTSLKMADCHHLSPWGWCLKPCQKGRHNYRNDGKPSVVPGLFVGFRHVHMSTLLVEPIVFKTWIRTVRRSPFQENMYIFLTNNIAIFIYNIKYTQSNQDWLLRSCFKKKHEAWVDWSYIGISIYPPCKSL